MVVSLIIKTKAPKETIEETPNEKLLNKLEAQLEILLEENKTLKDDLNKKTSVLREIFKGHLT